MMRPRRIIDDLTKEFALARRPPARTAHGRAAALARARLALIRARTRLVVAHTAVTAARIRVQQAQAVVARSRRAVARAKADLRGYAQARPSHTPSKEA